MSSHLVSGLGWDGIGLWESGSNMRVRYSSTVFFPLFVSLYVSDLPNVTKVLF